MKKKSEKNERLVKLLGSVEEIFNAKLKMAKGRRQVFLFTTFFSFCSPFNIFVEREETKETIRCLEHKRGHKELQTRTTHAVVPLHVLAQRPSFK